MNKKEISRELETVSPNNCAITRICGCYVDGEKNKDRTEKEAFLSLSEEEMLILLKYSRKLFPEPSART